VESREHPRSFEAFIPVAVGKGLMFMRQKSNIIDQGEKLWRLKIQRLLKGVGKEKVEEIQVVLSAFD